jgi:hypothetical protein
MFCLVKKDIEVAVRVGLTEMSVSNLLSAERHGSRRVKRSRSDGPLSTRLIRALLPLDMNFRGHPQARVFVRDDPGVPFSQLVVRTGRIEVPVGVERNLTGALNRVATRSSNAPDRSGEPPLTKRTPSDPPSATTLEPAPENITMFSESGVAWIGAGASSARTNPASGINAAPPKADLTNSRRLGVLTAAEFIAKPGDNSREGLGSGLPPGCRLSGGCDVDCLMKIFSVSVGWDPNRMERVFVLSAV